MDLLTIQEAATALRISPRALRALLEAGEIPHPRCSARAVRVDRQALAEWVARGGAPVPVKQDSAAAAN